MDDRLVAWARMVKSRRSRRGAVLWLFTDAQRLPEPLPVVARLPAGLCGVVFRHDGDANRAALGQRLAELCRSRRLALVVAGDWRLAVRLRAGLHIRGGRKPLGAPRSIVRTSSAHGVAELVRARRLGAGLAFLSPVLPTASHPGGAFLGLRRWAAIARRVGLPVAALGGIDGARCRGLSLRVCAGVGSIGAFVT